MQLNRTPNALTKTDRDNLNKNWTALEEEINRLGPAPALAELAKRAAENAQAQVNALVINGDSSPAAAQAAVDAKGINKGSLKKRIDDDYNEVSRLLEEKASKKELLGATSTFKESYQTLALLQAAYPTGDAFNHAVLADKFIYTYKNGWISTGILANGTAIPDYSIGTQQTDFIVREEAGVQDININSLFTITGSVSYLTGVLNTTSTTIKTTDFIRLEPDDFIFRFVLDGLNSGVYTDYSRAYYDENFAFISGVAQGTDYVVEKHNGLFGRKYSRPANAVYVRLNCNIANLEGGAGNKYTYLKVSKMFFNKLVNDYNLRLIDEKISSALEGKLDTIISSPLKGEEVAMFGDSTVGNERGPTSVPNLLAAMTGATVHNLGFGGTRMAGRNDSNSQAQYWDKFSMCRIADCIVSGDFTPMEQALPFMTGAPAYFQETINLLKTLDFTKIKIVTTNQMTNDFTGKNKIFNPENPTDLYSFYGAYKYVIEKLLTKFPHLRFILVTGTYRFWSDAEYNFLYDSDTHIIEDQKLPQFVDELFKIGKEEHLPVIDMYYGLDANKYTRLEYFKKEDGTHHYSNGRYRIASRLGHQMGVVI